MDISEMNDPVEVESRPLAPLDSALNELGMLATSSNSRKEYLSEIKTKNYLNMLTINTRYVSNVSIGFRVRPSTPHVRYKPYQMPLKERHRTRSENNDTESTSSLAQKIVEDCISESLVEISQLKRAKSLESIIAEGNENRDLKAIKYGSHNDLEQVSDAVQKLKM
ncbi:hypothetical protein ABEB36_008596 [Hypothenemus hampei]|uniref:Uncharacterized protein n=1 Tax=Hypothenemus hampei TaxID=57062 RepID=A0ABD1EME7_HYPHA